MSLASAILKLDSLVSNPTLDRTFKAVIAVVAAQGALYTTVIPHTPPVSTSAELAGGSGVVVALISLIYTWANASQTKQLNKLQAAIDAAAQEIFNRHALVAAAATVPPHTAA